MTTLEFARRQKERLEIALGRLIQIGDQRPADRSERFRDTSDLNHIIEHFRADLTKVHRVIASEEAYEARRAVELATTHAPPPPVPTGSQYHYQENKSERPAKGASERNEGELGQGQAPPGAGG